MVIKAAAMQDQSQCMDVQKQAGGCNYACLFAIVIVTTLATGKHPYPDNASHQTLLRGTLSTFSLTKLNEKADKVHSGHCFHCGIQMTVCEIEAQ